MDLIIDGRGGLNSSRVIYCPQLSYHLLSVSEICKLGKRVLFDEHFVSIWDKVPDQEVRGGFPSNGLYKIHALASTTGMRVIYGTTGLVTYMVMLFNRLSLSSWWLVSPM